MPRFDLLSFVLRKDPLTMDELYNIVEQIRTELVRFFDRYSLGQFGSHLPDAYMSLDPHAWDRVRVQGDARFSLRTRGMFELVPEVGAIFGITKENQLLVGWILSNFENLEVRFQEVGTLRELCEAVRIHPWRINRLMRNEVRDWVDHRRALLEEAESIFNICFWLGSIIERLLTPWEPPPTT